MFIAVAETLRDTGTIEPIQLLTRLASHYEPARGFGRGTKLALKAFEAGTDWRKIAHAAWPAGSRGNGGAVRAAAVALRPWATNEDLLAAIHLATRVSHAHPEALELAALHGTLVATTLSRPGLIDDASAILDVTAQRLPDSPTMREAILAEWRNAFARRTGLARRFNSNHARRYVRPELVCRGRRKRC